MSEETKNPVKDFVDMVASGDNAGAGEAFKDALRDKVATGLDAQRIEVAKHIFNGAEAQPFSDPKPNVTDPSDETSDVIHTDGSQIEFTPNTETEAQTDAESQ